MKVKKAKQKMAGAMRLLLVGAMLISDKATASAARIALEQRAIGRLIPVGFLRFVPGTDFKLRTRPSVGPVRDDADKTAFDFSSARPNQVVPAYSGVDQVKSTGKSEAAGAFKLGHHKYFDAFLSRLGIVRADPASAAKFDSGPQKSGGPAMRVPAPTDQEGPGIGAENVLEAPDSRENRKQALEWLSSPRKIEILAHAQPGHVPMEFETRSMIKILDAKDSGMHVVFLSSHKILPEMAREIIMADGGDDSFMSRVHLISLDDDRPGTLTQKLLDRRDKIEEIRTLIGTIGAPAALFTHLTDDQSPREAARALGAAYYAPHPSLSPLSTKSGNRKLFRALGLPLADGAEDIASEESLAREIEVLWSRLEGRKTFLERIAARLTGKNASIMVKLNVGSSGEGNAKMRLPRWRLSQAARLAAIRAAFPSMKFYGGQGWESFKKEISRIGAVAEMFLESAGPVLSPSGQAEIMPDGRARILSTHDQIISNGNNYVGAVFPATRERGTITEMTLAVGQALSARGVIGRFAVDYLAFPESGRIFPIEINIRVGGTTFPYETAVHLTEARYDLERGLLIRPDGRPVYYKVVDHDMRPELEGIPVDVFFKFFHEGPGRPAGFDARTKKGVVFHMLNLIPRSGNVAYTILAESPEELKTLQAGLDRLLDQLGNQYAQPRPPSPDGGHAKLPPSYKMYFLRSLLDQFGSWMGAVLLPVYAFKMADPAFSAWGQFILYAGLLLGGPLGARWARRHGSRWTFMATAAMTSVALLMTASSGYFGFSFSAAYLIGRLVSGVSGGAEMGVAEKDIIPHIVGKDPVLLDRANGLFLAAKKITGFIAPPTAALLSPILGIEPLLLAAAALVLLSIPPTWAVQYQENPRISRGPETKAVSGGKALSRLDMAAFSFLSFIELGFFGFLGPFLGMAAFPDPLEIWGTFELSSGTMPGILIGFYSLGSLISASLFGLSASRLKKSGIGFDLERFLKADAARWFQSAAAANAIFLAGVLTLRHQILAVLTAAILGMAVTGALIRWTTSVQSGEYGDVASIFKTAFSRAVVFLLAGLLVLTAGTLLPSIPIIYPLAVVSTAIAMIGTIIGVLMIRRRK